MAIAIEREKKRINFVALLGAVAIIGIIAGVIYYLFFAAIPGIETIVPSRLKSAGEIAKIELNPQEVFENPVFRNLRQYVNPLEAESATNPLPFLLP